MLLIAVALFLQTLHGPHAYTTTADSGALVLSTQTGTYSMELGWGCDNFGTGLVVEILAGSGGVAALVPVGTETLCNIYITEKLDETPCMVNADGVCDLSAE